MTLRAVFSRLTQSAIVWFWGFNALRLASGLLLLPILLMVLPTADLGMYYLFLSLYALLPIIDFGFSFSVARYVSYAMAGAPRLTAHGLVAGPPDAPPNYPLLWDLVHTIRRLYQVLALVTIAVMGGLGTWAVAARIGDTINPSVTWLAWGVTLGAAAFEVYSSWWGVLLRSMNAVVVWMRIGLLAYAVRFVIALGLLLAGFGLLAVPVASFFGSSLNIVLTRRASLQRLPAGDGSRHPEKSLFPLLWPNSWRAGLQFLSGYGATHANALICSAFFGLAPTAQYGLSLQVAQVATGMAAAWVTVKWPLVGHYRTREDYPTLRQILQPRVRLQAITYLMLAVGAFAFGPWLLRLHGGGKELLPPLWFGLLLATQMLELQFSFWTTLLSMDNYIPSLWPTVITNAASLVLVLLFVQFTDLRLGALVLAPFLAGCAFSYWYWPLRGARSLRTDWLRFMFARAT